MDMQRAVYPLHRGRPAGWEVTFHECLPNQLLIWFRTGRLRPQDAEILETHLCLCPICQLQLSNLDFRVSAQQ
jgi:hypothetical protein